MRFVFAPSPSQGGVGGTWQSNALPLRSGSALPGRAFGWDGGEMVEVSRVDFNVFTPNCAPRIGLQADAVQRARRMRLESPASPPALPLKEGGGNSS
jgi:hypothetical protein